MYLVSAPNAEAVSKVGAALLAAAIRAKPDANVVVATGNTPMGVYKELAQLHQQGELDTSQLRVFQLDAYLGLAPDDKCSLQGWTRRAFIEPLEISELHFTPLEANTSNPNRACQIYHQTVLGGGGYDLAILGLGPNGHLGFNEPPSAALATTRVVTLTEASLKSNATYWGEREFVPRQALTAGMDLLLNAKQILLMVTGEHKREILDKSLKGQVSKDVPASYLQTVANVTVLADDTALSKS